MSKRIIFSLFSLICFIAQPVLANNGASDWDKLVADANKTMESGDCNHNDGQDTPSWDTMTQRSDAAMNRFSNTGQGFDVASTDNRMVAKLTADDTSTLTGRFYDLKQPVVDGAKPLSGQSVVSFIKNFMESGWDRSLLEQYYSPSVNLEAPYLYLPRCKASYAPLAFDCNTGNQERKVEPQNWVVLYTGTVIAPESGHFRFVGMGDDAIVVRFDNKVVLEAGWTIPSRNHMTLGITREYQKEITSPSGGRALYQYKETPHWNERLGGIPTGRHFNVTKGKAYPIEILLSEIPGNEFGYCLLIEKVKGNGERGQFKPDESPTLALFRTNSLLPDLKEITKSLKRNGINYAVGKTLEIPPFLEDSPIWTLTEDTKQKRTVLERMSATVIDSEDDTAMGRRSRRGQAHDYSSTANPDASASDNKTRKGYSKHKKKGKKGHKKNNQFKALNLN